MRGAAGICAVPITALVLTLSGAGCRLLADYAPAPTPDLDVAHSELGALDGSHREGGAMEGGVSDGPGPLFPDDPAPPLLKEDDRPPYTVTADRVGLRLPLFRDGQSGYRMVSALYGNDVLGWWIVGEAGWIAHNPGDGFRRVGDPMKLPTQDLFAVWATAPDAVFMGGDHHPVLKGQVLQFQGRALGFIQHAAPSGPAVVVTGFGGRSKDDFWCSTDTAGTLLRFDGASLRSFDTGQSEVHHRPWVAGDGMFWFPSKGAVAVFDGANWKQQSIPGAGSISFRSIFGLSETRFFLGATDNLVSWLDGKLFPPALTEGRQIAAIWGRGLDEVWAVGGPYVFRWDGAGWTTAWTDPSINSADTRSFKMSAPAARSGPAWPPPAVTCCATIRRSPSPGGASRWPLPGTIARWSRRDGSARAARSGSSAPPPCCASAAGASR